MAVVRTDVAEELYCHHRQGGKISDLRTTLAVTIRSSETSVPTRATRRHIPEDGILLSYCSDQCDLWSWYDVAPRLKNKLQLLLKTNAVPSALHTLRSDVGVFTLHWTELPDAFCIPTSASCLASVNILHHLPPYPLCTPVKLYVNIM
jgi:hypothetical protein